MAQDSKDQTTTNLDDLVAEADTGARAPRDRFSIYVLWCVPLAWSLYQLWIASPLPFMFGIGVGNDVPTRAIHLAFAVFLAFVAYPTFKRSPRHYIPAVDWILAILAAGATAYLWYDYAGVTSRTGTPSELDIVASVIGIVLLLEAARRSLGFPLMAVAMVFLAYIFFGSWEGLPDVLRWKGATLERAADQLWLTPEGVFGTALSVSSGFVFLFVLFGALLNQAGAGNYFVQIAFSLLGHLSGGPAKAAVVSSAMTGLVSGSSIANVVTTGTFTIPLMKRVGFTPAKAGAVEVSSSVNGVLTPPVMGAVAFLMVEYVGVPYIEVVRTAIVPALISYIALVYIVHLEAMKNGMRGLERSEAVISPLKARLIRTGLIVSSLLILAYVIDLILRLFEIAPNTIPVGAVMLIACIAYLILVWRSARVPDLKMEDPNEPMVRLPSFREVAPTGAYFVVPVVVLMWLLIVNRLSAGAAALWAAVFMIIILITQKPLKAFFRDPAGNLSRLGQLLKEGVVDLADGMVTGARNMIGLAAAMGVAGIIVGAVTLSGIGQQMAEIVENLSGGNLLLMLVFVALISIVLGMGLPTTANYIVVSSLMANVVVELGAQSGLIVPLIAVHMFVFYYGIMADVTPPVGLASFAAAAISGADPLKTGFTAFYYSLRTALLPFLFIFNTDLLLIDVEPLHALLVFIVALIAMLVFAAGTMGYFLTRNRWYESLLLVLVALILFRPGAILDQIEPRFAELPPTELFATVEAAPSGGDLRVVIEGENIDGDFRSATYLIPLGEAGGSASERTFDAAGLEFAERDGGVVVDFVQLGLRKYAEQAGIEFDWVVTRVEVENERMPKEIFYLPALLILGLVIVLQRRRRPQAQSVVAEV